MRRLDLYLMVWNGCILVLDTWQHSKTSDIQTLCMQEAKTLVSMQARQLPVSYTYLHSDKTGVRDNYTQVLHCISFIWLGHEFHKILFTSVNLRCVQLWFPYSILIVNECKGWALPILCVFLFSILYVGLLGSVRYNPTKT